MTTPTPIETNKTNSAISSGPLCLELFGDIKDAIYQLGHLDSEDVNLAWQGIEESSYFGPRFLKSPLHKIFSQVFARQTKLLSPKQRENSFYYEIFKDFIEQYAQGLNTSNENALYLCFMNEFLNNPSAIFEGIDDQHLEGEACDKLINSPNQEFFYQKLRFVKIETDNNLSATVLQNLANPFAPHGGINEAGISLKLIQRNALKLNYEGLSASFIALVTLLGFDDIDEAAKFLLEQQLVFHWEFHLSDRNGNSIAIAIDGNEALEITPKPDEIDPLAQMAKAHNQYYIKNHLPLSLATLEISPETIGLSLYNSNVHHIDHYQLKNFKLEHKKSKLTKEVNHIFKLKNLLNKAQIAFNENRDEDCYHGLQLAIVCAKKNFSKNRKLLAKLNLTFLACQYIFESHKETYQFIFQQLLAIYDDLDTYHKDLSLILMQRLQILMDVEINLIEQSHHSKRILFTEAKLGKVAHLALKKTTLLRPNHLDFCALNGL